MTNNPYAPPTANVADVRPDNDARPAYFAVSTTKFVVMSMCTLSFYMIYWFYSHWRIIKDREGSDIFPVMRAIFAVFFVYSLFTNIRDDADRLGVKSVANVGAAAIGWVLITLIGNYSDFFFYVSFFSVFFAVPIQACANRINQHVSPDHDPNSQFTGWNILWIVVGVLLAALSIVGLTLSED
jgi:hypothetical protein